MILSSIWIFGHVTSVMKSEIKHSKIKSLPPRFKNRVLSALRSVRNTLDRNNVANFYNKENFFWLIIYKRLMGALIHTFPKTNLTGLDGPILKKLDLALTKRQEKDYVLNEFEKLHTDNPTNTFFYRTAFYPYERAYTLLPILCWMNTFRFSLRIHCIHQPYLPLLPGQYPRPSEAKRICSWEEGTMRSLIKHGIP